ncbi:short coiled-coil protein-like [Thomomys bottae]
MSTHAEVLMSPPTPPKPAGERERIPPPQGETRKDQSQMLAQTPASLPETITQHTHRHKNKKDVSRSRSPSRRRDLGIPPLRRLRDHSSGAVCPRCSSVPRLINADMDAVDAENQVELEEKTRLINQVLELQHTLEDLSARVDAVKEENLKLKSENQVLGQYIENLMSASSVFQTTDTKSKRK